MKISQKTLLGLLFSGILLSVPAFAEPAFLSAQGTKLVAEEREVQLKGVNLGGWLLQETWMTPVKGSKDHWTTIDVLTRRFGAEKAAALFRAYEDRWITAWDLDSIRDLGFNVVRVPFGYWNLQSETGEWKRGPDGEIDFGRLDWIVQECARRNLYVILDLHGAPGFASNEHSSGKVGASRLFEPGAEGEAFRARTVTLWREVAQHFRGSPAVAAYDLLNEPMAKTSDADLWKFYDRIYRAIRHFDPDHLISVEAIWEVGNLPDPKEFGWKNMLYQTHDYGWDQDQAKFLAGKLRSSALIYDYGVPLLVGEFNAFGKFSDWDNALQSYDEAGFQWTLWTYKLTKKGTTPWALYSGPFVVSPDVTEDSYEDILMAWLSVETSSSNFTRNDDLAASLTKSLRRPAYPKPLPEPGKTASAPAGTRYEAEDAVIVLSSHRKAGLKAGTESQGFFSGHLAAGGLNSSVKKGDVLPDWSNLPHVRFLVKVAAAGTCQLTLVYNGDDDKTILVRTNSGQPQEVHLPQLAGGAWNVMHRKDLSVELLAGENEVFVSGTLAGKGWENVDFMEIHEAPLARNP